MKKSLILFAAGVFALLYSCGDDTQSSITVGEANLYLTVQDASNGNPLNDADVAIGSVSGKTKDGLVKLKIQAGTQVALVSKESFASARLALGSDAVSNGVSIVDDIYEDVSLYPLTAGLTGTLYYTNSRGKSVPMAGMPIRVDVQVSSLVKTSYDCGVTDAAGKYTCTGLPAVGSNYKVYALGVNIGGVNYAPKELKASSLTSYQVSLLAGVTANSRKEDYGAASLAQILLNVPGDISFDDKDKPLTLEFSEAVDSSLFKSTWIAASQAISIAWKDCAAADGVTGCKKVEISPLPAWLNETVINFSGITSVSGKIFNISPITIKVLDVDISAAVIEVAVSPVTGETAIGYASTKAKITWNKVAGATGYRVLVQTSDTTDFEEVAAITDTTDEVMINRYKNPVSLSGFESGWTAGSIGSKVNKVIVQAYNNTSKSPFSAAKEIKATDDAKAPNFINSDAMVFDPCAFSFSNGTAWLCRAGYKKINQTAPTIPGLVAGKPYLEPDADGVVKFLRSLTWGPLFDATEFANESQFGPEGYRVKLAEVLKETNAYEADIYGRPEKAGTLHGRVYFNKPMKAEIGVECRAAGKTAAQSVDDPGCKKLKVAATWETDQVLSLAVSTVKGNVVPESVEKVDITYAITGLTGVNGLAFAAGSPTSVNEVRIRFVADFVCNIPANQNDFTKCPAQYCASATGKTDFTNCLSVACENVGYSDNRCENEPNYCSRYGNWHNFDKCGCGYITWEVYDKCPEVSCKGQPGGLAPDGSPYSGNANNPVCIAWPESGYCGTTAAGNISVSETVCNAYCLSSTDSGCTYWNDNYYCSTNAGKLNYTNCQTEACNNNASGSVDCSGYCGTATGLGDYDHCADDICAGGTAYNEYCADWCTENNLDGTYDTVCSDN